jgi:hypothetical protein
MHGVLNGWVYDAGAQQLGEGLQTSEAVVIRATDTGCYQAQMGLEFEHYLSLLQ